MMQKLAFLVFIGVIIYSEALSVNQLTSLERRLTKELAQDCYKGPLDISFVLDASNSIWMQNFTKAKNFVNSFVDPFFIGPDNVRISVETYGETVFTEDVLFLTDKQRKRRVKQHISNLVWRGGERTETGLGIEFMREKIMSAARDGVRKICIVITDGNSQEPDVTKRQSEIARQSGIQMFAVGVSDKVTREELTNIAGDPARVHIVQTYSELEEIKEALFGGACGSVAPPTDKPPCCCDKTKTA